ncbi:unnamed protein product [Protopolystoma xenopodis]|uniref:Peptidase C1A papain C-terminal domain-containing protein n=1 Tax=Protopolystoma xenopodis TaxID=117903 RepID=A0A448XKU1_9PLAT|nr:unnamed protein product [Protopolystoma xenopodis]
MSDRNCIYSSGRYTEELSREDMLSCCGRFCGLGCEGGYPSRTWKYWIESGIVTGGAYQAEDSCKPYEFPPCSHHVNSTYPPCGALYPTPKCVKTCQTDYGKSYTKDLHSGEITLKIPKTCSLVFQVKGEEKIMMELMKNGPLEAVFDVYGDFMNYKSGVYQDEAGEYINPHIVKLIGWGVEENTKYWLWINSWNNVWGDNGLFKIIRGVDKCRIESDQLGGVTKV